MEGPAVKLASFEVGTDVGPARRVGVLADRSTLVDVTAGYGAVLADEGDQSPVAVAETVAPPEMIAFLERGERAMTAAREVREFAADRDFAADGDGERGPGGARLRYDLEEVRLLSPVPRPNSLRDFMVVEEHVRNALGDDIPEPWFDIPVHYKGDADCIAHPGEDVEWPAYTDQMDYELELAAVIGREGRDVPAEAAEEYIAGYTIYNDLSARDIQFEEMEVNLGPAKGKDFLGSNALGPYLVTPDEIDITEVSMTARVDGEVWSDGSLGAMQHSFAEMIAFTSQNLRLRPGDVLGSGTVGMGCGLEMDRYLEPGNTVELEVEGIGTLRNRVVKA
jgi:2-keto-4-pentenoate hydratase/2-oxohepta-3-ene-1,7-dioic acid hydratase in catechol pathway